MMPFYFWLGVVIVYTGLAALLSEIIFDPELLRRRYQIQVLGIVVVFFLFDWFTIGVVGARAPIILYAYAMRKGDYPAGTIIGGISWDSHFTDLRVAITNPTDDTYEDIDLIVQADKWSYKAALLNTPPDCNLTPIGGETIFTARTRESGPLTVTTSRVGTGYDAHDSMGNVYTPLATESGYRLVCGKLPAHFTIQLVVAAVALGTLIIDLMPTHPTDPGIWGTTIEEIAGATSPFDLLDARPSPSTVMIKGSYIKKVKPYSITRAVNVENGN
jgi:hypothetical protein